MKKKELLFWFLLGSFVYHIISIVLEVILL